MSGRRETVTQLDSAIDVLLGQRARPMPLDDDELIATACLLRDALPRFHPRFGFEELLAQRLATAAVGAATTDSSEPVRLRQADPAGETANAPVRRRRGLLAGGAIASGVSLAIPIAGAALVVWRRARAGGGML